MALPFTAAHCLTKARCRFGKSARSQRQIRAFATRAAADSYADLRHHADGGNPDAQTFAEGGLAPVRPRPGVASLAKRQRPLCFCRIAGWRGCISGSGEVGDADPWLPSSVTYCYEDQPRTTTGGAVSKAMSWVDPPARN